MLEALIDGLRDGPLEMRGGGVTWRLETREGFADWLELVYEAGEPLGLSARLFDRPRICAGNLAERLSSDRCVVMQVDAAPDLLGPATFQEALARPPGRPPAVADEARACALLYRTLKIWTAVNR